MGRPSHVRSAVAELLAGSSRHDWSIDDTVDALRARGVEADFSSVFRALSHLAAAGSVRQVELGDGKARFETVGEHHEHIRCERCGRVSAVPGCLVADAVPAVEEATGFAVTGHRVLFSGRCAPCARDAG